MTKFYVVITATVDADDPDEAYREVVEHPRRYEVRVWQVPESIDVDPELTTFQPKEEHS